MNDNLILDDDFNSDGKDRIHVDLLTKYNFIILYFLTFGLYGSYWQYKTWTFFKQRQNLDIWPIPRAIFAIFFIYSLFEKILAFAKYNEVSKTYSSGGLFALFAVLTYGADKLPEPLFLLSLLAVFAYLQPINVFNLAMINSDDFDAKYLEGFTQKQLILIVCGVIFWLLLILGLLPGTTEF